MKRFILIAALAAACATSNLAAAAEYSQKAIHYAKYQKAAVAEKAVNDNWAAKFWEQNLLNRN